MMAGEYSSKGLIWPLLPRIYFLAFVGALTLLLDWLEKKRAISVHKRKDSVPILEVKDIEKIWYSGSEED